MLTIWQWWQTGYAQQAKRSVPDIPSTPARRTVGTVADNLVAPQRADYVELGVSSCFSFLHGASDAVDLVLTARALGYDALGIADVNSLAGIVRLHTEAKALNLKPIIGCRIETVEGLSFLAYPVDRTAYGRLCRLISAGRMARLDGSWQAKGQCEIDLGMLARHATGVQLVLIPPQRLDKEFHVSHEESKFPPEASALRIVRQAAQSGPLETVLPYLAERLPTLRHIAASYLYFGDDIARIEALDALARRHGMSLLATNDVLYHAPERRPLQDVMSAIRHKTTVANAGHILHPNAERHLKSPDEMVRLFARWPHAIAATRTVADACHFSLEELRYEYPEEICPDGGQTMPRRRADHARMEGRPCPDHRWSASQKNTPPARKFSPLSYVVLIPDTDGEGLGHALDTSLTHHPCPLLTTRLDRP